MNGDHEEIERQSTTAMESLMHRYQPMVFSFHYFISQAGIREKRSKMKEGKVR